MLSSAILRGVDDAKKLGFDLQAPSPLRDLVQAYNKKAVGGNILPVITTESTGLELKNAIEMLDPRDQVSLLHKYSNDTGDLDTPTTYVDDPDSASKRKMRELAIKTGLFLFIIFISGTLSIAGVMFAQGKDITSSPVLKAIAGPVLELIKMIIQTALGK